jgi:hypothetical protein
LRHNAIHWTFELVALPNRSEVWALDTAFVRRHYGGPGEGLSSTTDNCIAWATVVTLHGASRRGPRRDIAIVDFIGLAIRAFLHDLIANDSGTANVLLNDIRNPVAAPLHLLPVLIVQNTFLVLFTLRALLVAILRCGGLGQHAHELVQRRR